MCRWQSGRMHPPVERVPKSAVVRIHPCTPMLAWPNGRGSRLKTGRGTLFKAGLMGVRIPPPVPRLPVSSSRQGTALVRQGPRFDSSYRLHADSVHEWAASSNWESGRLAPGRFRVRVPGGPPSRARCCRRHPGSPGRRRGFEARCPLHWRVAGVVTGRVASAWPGANPAGVRLPHSPPIAAWRNWKRRRL